MASQPPPQTLPRPYPGRFAYPQPQRLDSRQPPGAQYQDMKVPSRPIPPPAQNSDSYRSRSMARMGGPPVYGPPPSSFNHTSATAFRQQPYQPAAPMTAQGRVVPERNTNERAMSMTSYAGDGNQTHATTSTGRVIPARRQPSGPALSPLVPPTKQEPEQAFVQNNTNNNSMTGKARSPSDASTTSRSMSMVSTIGPDRTMSIQSQTPRTNVLVNHVASTSRRSKVPLVYPALLSRVADLFREKVALGERQKNGLSYQNSFSGAEAVDLIGYIVKTNDRNLALLLGRARVAHP